MQISEYIRSQQCETKQNIRRKKTHSQALRRVIVEDRLIVLSAVFISKMQNKPKAVHIVMGGNLNVFFYLIKNAPFSYAAVRWSAPGDMTAQFHLGSRVLTFSPDICTGQVCLDSRKHIWNFLFPINLWLEANGHINISDLF